MDIITDTFKQIFNIIVGRMPRKSKSFLKRRGDFVINSMMIRRSPIQKFIDKALNLLSFGKFDELKNKYGYDKLFHLSLIITLSNGEQYTIEKNEIINLGGSVPSDTDETEYLAVDMKTERITVNELIEKTIKYMTEDKFLEYNAVNNNCQVFILSILKANNLNTTQTETFILQDAEKIFEEMPEYIEKVAKITTDTGGYVSRIRDFIGLKKGGRVKRYGLKQSRNNYKKRKFKF